MASWSDEKCVQHDKVACKKDNFTPKSILEAKYYQKEVENGYVWVFLNILLHFKP